MRGAGDPHRAYPRAGGGTGLRPRSHRRRPGLSPRRRGNLPPRSVLDVSLGPIPAQAGEPRSPTRTGTAPRAYPRAGGGTPSIARTAAIELGLSPRRRGNHVAGRVRELRPGPIPAQAGEPRPPHQTSPPLRAYPRAGGGTRAGDGGDACRRGLSPRRRGNRRRAGSADTWRRPIPAQAGEPPLPTRRHGQSGAYPRAGGGTKF